MICDRCDKRLENAYHFRQLAESSSKHFASIRSKKSSNDCLPPPRILNSQKANDVGKLSSSEQLDADGKEWIEITKQSGSGNIDATLKSETVVDSEDDARCTSPVVYMVDDADGNIKVKPRDYKKDPTKLPTSTPNSEADENAGEYSTDNDDDDEATDAIAFLLNHKKATEANIAYNNRKYECTLCTKRFVGKSNLVDHLRYHANIRNYKCTHCDKTFIQSGSLKSHLRTHTAEKPFECLQCGKRFGQKSALTVHTRTHTQERKFVCDTCSKAFMTSGDLVKHKLIHDSIKKFCCDVCGMRSAQKVNMKKHKLKVHGIADEPIFPVDIFTSNETITS